MKKSKPKKKVTLKVKQHKCVELERKHIMKSDPNIEYVRFDLHNITSWNTSGIITKRGKSGQWLWLGYKGKKRELKTFLPHVYCPWCGKKY